MTYNEKKQVLHKRAVVYLLMMKISGKLLKITIKMNILSS